MNRSKLVEEKFSFQQSDAVPILGLAFQESRSFHFFFQEDTFHGIVKEKAFSVPFKVSLAGLRIKLT